MRHARQTDRLFFAVIPPSDMARRIGHLARPEREFHGLSGRPLAAGHFHATLLHIVDDCLAPPLALTRKLARRAASVDMPAFRVSFDRIMSFRNGAFVLCGGERLVGLEILRDRLTMSVGIGCSEKRSEEHTSELQ